MSFDKDAYATLFTDYATNLRIRKSQATFKIKLFIDKAENSLLIAQFAKDVHPTEGQPKKIHWNYWAITIAYYAMLYAAKAAILTKGYEASDHDAVQIALGHLLVPDALEREDLELLNQSHKIFEDDYVTYFEDAKKESHVARYAAVKTYTERRLEEIFENARAFVAKISLMLQET